ncbi:MAG: cytochrome c3 family protein [Planctomycetota bacterium]
MTAPVSGSWTPFFVVTFWSLLIATGLAASVTFFGSTNLDPRPVVQPVQFNHKKHVEDAGLECESCHQGCKEGVHSGLPGLAACSLCHTEPQGESEAEKVIVRLVDEGKEPEWTSLFRQETYVFFSHRRHTTVAKLECKECHGDMGSSTEPPPTRMPVRMYQCWDCHERKHAPNDCTTCHR